MTGTRKRQNLQDGPTKKSSSSLFGDLKDRCKMAAVVDNHPHPYLIWYTYIRGSKYSEKLDLYQHMVVLHNAKLIQLYYLKTTNLEDLRCIPHTNLSTKTAHKALNDFLKQSFWQWSALALERALQHQLRRLNGPICFRG